MFRLIGDYCADHNQDELEQELERLKDKLARSQKKSSKSSTETRPRVSSDSAAAQCPLAASASLEGGVCGKY
jgi:CAP-Gly domain-containing linker protein 1